MYSILLVEDEKVELDTLKNYVNWQGTGIDQVYTARGARSAMAIVAEHEPDIVITDIQMPKISGIELARMIREEGYNCKIVFLTGYDRFDYAKEAISLHAEDYLLKPFQIDEVEELVKRLVSEISATEEVGKIEKLAAGKVLEGICYDSDHNLEEISAQHFGAKPEQVAFRLTGLYALSPEMKKFINEQPEIIHSFLTEEMMLVISESSSAPGYLNQRIRSHFPQKDIRSVVCDRLVNLRQLADAYRKILVCQDDLFFGQVNMQMTAEEHQIYRDYENVFDKSALKQPLLKAILTGNLILSINYFSEILMKFEGMTREAYSQNVFSLYLFLKDGMQDEKIDLDILHCQTKVKMKKMMMDYIQEQVLYYRSRNKEYLSEYVKRYIDLYYMEDCTVEEMAEGVDLSTNYLRKKFKEDMGMTILDYVTRTRLEQAKRLLETSDQMVKEISVAVGYLNISYFTKIFSKRYGVTPNEYRSMVQKTAE